MKKVARHLFYFDILGFSKRVKEKSVDHVIETIQDTLNLFRRLEEKSSQFKLIYFSDTFLLYQDSEGFNIENFLSIYISGSIILTALLAKKIPARGTIVFGNFYAQDKSNSLNQIYFGEALIEAYNAEKKDKWIGITAQKSAWQQHKEFGQLLDELQGRIKFLKKNENGVLLLNPFFFIYDVYSNHRCVVAYSKHSSWNDPGFINNLCGFRFLLDKSKNYKDKGDYNSKEATKYHSTVMFLQDIMGEEMFNWTKKCANDKKITLIQKDIDANLQDSGNDD